jgi:hypothetical protein
MPPSPKYTLVQKAEFLMLAHKMQREGASNREIAEHLGLNIASLNSWLRNATLDRLYPPKPLLMPRNRSHGNR